MKKLLLVLPVVALAACSSDIKDIENTMAQWACEQIAKTSTHIVYKCPSSLEWVKNVKTLEPTGKWVDWSGIDETKVSEMAKDTEYTYVEVAFDQPGWNKTCEEDYTMRTMLKEPSEEDWAFVGCR